MITLTGPRWSSTAATAVGVLTVVFLCTLLTLVDPGTARATPALALVLPVVIAGLLGGRVAALVTAVCAGAALNFAFIPPRWTLKINSVDDATAFVVFIVVALVVGSLVAWEADRRRSAERRTAEVEELHRQFQLVVAERAELIEESHQLAILTQVDEQRRAMLRSVSHDLRTPLAAIRAVTSDMRAGAAYDPGTRDELLDVVGEEAERLDRLVDNLLAMSKIEAGVLQPNRQAIALDELVADRVRRLSRLFTRVDIVTSVPSGLPLVDADYGQLDQVLTNLVENAARHSPDGGRIEIGARADAPHVTVFVSDEGPGIDPAQREELFEPFRRGPGSDSSGIGLAICRAIVDAHGCSIEASNRPEGGALFTFTLPAHDG
jgi:K+-sensing histidine kinase KdpD